MSAQGVNDTHSRSTEYQVIIVLWLLVFVAGSQVLIIAPLLPEISEQIAVSQSLLGTLITAYTVSVGVFALITGPISDRIGRRRILLLGNMIMASALLLHWFTWDFASLFLVRAFAGVAGGILNGASLAYVGDFFPRERRGWANGWVASGGAAGLIAGVPIGTLLAEQFDFRLPFVVFGGVLVVALILLWRYVPQPTVPLSDQLTLQSALEGYVALLQQREGFAAVVIFVIMFAGNSLFTTYLPTWLGLVHGMGGGAISLMFFFGGVGTTLVAPIAGRLSDRFGRKIMVISASFGLSIIIFSTPYLIIHPWAAYGLFFIVMAVFTVRGTPFQTLLTEMVGSQQRGSFLNLTMGIGQIGAGVGGTLAGVAYTRIGYEGTTAVTAVIMIAIGSMVWLFLPETLGQSGDGSRPAGATTRQHTLGTDEGSSALPEDGVE